MGHSGSVNVGSEQTRHALLNRYHPTARLAPAPDLEPQEMSTLERANSARYLRERFGVGRCSQAAGPPASFPLPPMGPKPITCTFFLHGLFQLWLVDEDGSLVRWFSEDLSQIWTPAPAPELPTAEAASAIVDLQFHHCKIVMLSRFVALSVSLNQKVSLFQTSWRACCASFTKVAAASSSSPRRTRRRPAGSGSTRSASGARPASHSRGLSTREPTQPQPLGSRRG